MFTGIGEAGYAPAGNSMVGDVFPEDHRAKVMSWLSVAGLIGPISGMVLGGVIAGLGPGSWRLAFLVTGIPASSWPCSPGGCGNQYAVIGMLASSFDPGGLHFLHNVAGHDLILALVLQQHLCS
jgi:MFS family permease